MRVIEGFRLVNLSLRSDVRLACCNRNGNNEEFIKNNILSTHRYVNESVLIHITPRNYNGHGKHSKMFIMPNLMPLNIKTKYITICQIWFEQWFHAKQAIVHFTQILPHVYKIWARFLFHILSILASHYTSFSSWSNLWSFLSLIS